MRNTLIGLALLMSLSGCATDNAHDGPPGHWRNYDYNRPDPSYGGYDASRYHRDDPRYRDQRLKNRDRVYRGNDDRYYCRRSDGTTGLIIGAIAGGALGQLIARGRSETVATIIGAGVGAAIGREIDRDGIHCR